MIKPGLFSKAAISDPAELESAYLQAVFNHLDAQLELEVLQFQAAGQDTSDRFRGLATRSSDAIGMLRLGFGNRWGAGANVSSDALRIINKQKEKALQQMEAIEKTYSPRLVYLRQAFLLTMFEWWAFIIMLAPQTDLRYERIYGFLQDDVTRKAASLDLMLSLLLEDPADKLHKRDLMQPSGPLVRYKLAIPLDDPPQTQANSLRGLWRVDDEVVLWLLTGEMDPPGANLLPAQNSDSLARYNLPAADTINKIQPYIVITDADPVRRRMAASDVASSLGRALLHISPAEATWQADLVPALRNARLLNAIPYIDDVAILADREMELLPLSCGQLAVADGLVLFGSKRAFRFPSNQPESSIPVMKVALPAMGSGDRGELWELLLDGIEKQFSVTELHKAASQFSLSAGQIAHAATAAISRAVQAGRPMKLDDILSEARFHSGHHLGDLATKLEPRYQWDDLVLPKDPHEMLREMVATVQNRPLVLEDWGLGKKLAAGNGVSALFTGQPGTGKTLAAQIIANQLGIDLYRIDLSTVVSKFVGETEKNLEHVFSEAAESNALLFFDEADTIFGKRSEVKDAQDRYANLEVGYLLQRMEAYSGVAILATNLRANLDDAFTRRLNFIITFPFPDEEYRLKIFKVLMPPGLPLDSDVDLEWMANHFKLAGGSIRNILMSAAYQAARENGKVSQRHLLHGALREMQKMGKLINDKDFTQG